ncbi:hypothetical protein V1524DRAFT_417329 [Lipomyces starkeyi]
MRRCVLPEQRLNDADADADADANADADAYADKLSHITQEMAEHLVHKYRAATADLGCWRTTLKPESSGACRVCLSRRGPKPYVHHLALIADNRRAGMARIQGYKRRYYYVSRLGHDKQCFNPRHLHVESISDSWKRRACKGKTIVVRDGIRTHPCVHGGDENKYKCILPEQ